MAKQDRGGSTFWQSFREFIDQGSVFEIAVAVIMGAAFGKVISSLVNDLLMPVMGLLLGGINFTSLELRVGEAVINYGTFIQNITDFLVIAFSLFIMIRVLVRLNIKKVEESPDPGESNASSEEKILSEIRDLLKEGIKS
ncbi:MAG: large conductance mechanosensitive channel protein MscL [Firmicutes bacterium]|nr:large conductance mechanosensitive channel protein MscL [Bacillota bacterium]